jgi:hypothetical protein
VACQPASAPATSVQVCKFDQEPLCSCALHSIGNPSDPIFGLSTANQKRQDVGQITKQYNSEMRRAQHANNFQETSFVCSCAVRARLSRTGGGAFERSDALTSLSPQGFALSPACRAGCAQTKRPVSAHPCSDRLQHTPLRDVRRRVRPLSHAITAAPALCSHAHGQRRPQVLVDVSVTYTCTLEGCAARAAQA